MCRAAQFRWRTGMALPGEIGGGGGERDGKIYGEAGGGAFFPRFAQCEHEVEPIARQVDVPVGNRDPKENLRVGPDEMGVQRIDQQSPYSDRSTNADKQKKAK